MPYLFFKVKLNLVEAKGDEQSSQFLHLKLGLRTLAEPLQSHRRSCSRPPSEVTQSTGLRWDHSSMMGPTLISLPSLGDPPTREKPVFFQPLQFPAFSPTLGQGLHLWNTKGHNLLQSLCLPSGSKENPLDIPCFRLYLRLFLFLSLSWAGIGSADVSLFFHVTRKKKKKNRHKTRRQHLIFK